MALAIVETLERLGGMDEDVLAWAFSVRFRKDPDRGYGKMARRILQEICGGTPWREASEKAFGGGSYGNGAAMRVAPLGAYYADDLGILPAMATKSAKVTHSHPEGIAGAIAVAVATAVACNYKDSPSSVAADAIWQSVLDFTPESKVRIRLERARHFGAAKAKEVAEEVGNGAEVTAQDTVPFCIWSACQSLGSYQEAILSTIEVGGDCDTNAAIVGGIVAAYSGSHNIPKDWIAAREPLSLPK
jgi:ADP-ribosylglycohydrolase